MKQDEWLLRHCALRHELRTLHSSTWDHRDDKAGMLTHWWDTVQNKNSSTAEGCRQVAEKSYKKITNRKNTLTVNILINKNLNFTLPLHTVNNSRKTPMYLIAYRTGMWICGRGERCSVEPIWGQGCFSVLHVHQLKTAERGQEK